MVAMMGSSWQRKRSEVRVQLAHTKIFWFSKNLESGLHFAAESRKFSKQHHRLGFDTSLIRSFCMMALDGSNGQLQTDERSTEYNCKRCI